jgi:RNA-directed DNA polymerase
MGGSPIVDWALIDWRKAEQSVYRLQKRIFRASRRGDTQVVHVRPKRRYFPS